MPAVCEPYMAFAVVFEFVFSHCDDSFCLQKKHLDATCC